MAGSYTNGLEAPNRDKELLAALVKPGNETVEESDRGSRAEYTRSPMKVSQISRTISMVPENEKVFLRQRRNLAGV